MEFEYHDKCHVFMPYWLIFGSILHLGDPTCYLSIDFADGPAYMFASRINSAETLAEKAQEAAVFLALLKDVRSYDPKMADEILNFFRQYRIHGLTSMSDLPELQAALG